MSTNIEQLLLASRDGAEIGKALQATISADDALNPAAIAWYGRAATLLATVGDVSTAYSGHALFDRRTDLVRSLLPLPAFGAQYLVFHHMFAGRHPNSWPKCPAALHRYFSSFLPNYYLDRLIGDGIGKSTSASKDHHSYLEQLARVVLETASPEAESAHGYGCAQPCKGSS